MLHTADNTQCSPRSLANCALITSQTTTSQVRLSGRLVWRTRWDQKPDTSGTLLLDFRAPRRRGMEQYLCEGPRM